MIKKRKKQTKPTNKKASLKRDSSYPKWGLAAKNTCGPLQKDKTNLDLFTGRKKEQRHSHW